MRTIQKFILFILSLSYTSSYAQATANKTSNFVFTIPTSNLEKPDSITVMYWRENVVDNYNTQRTGALKMNDKGSYFFNLSEIDHITALRFIFFYPEGEPVASSLYYTEPSDKLNITVNKNGSNLKLEFSGKGFAKFAFIDSLNKDLLNLRNQVTQLRRNNGDLKIYSSDCDTKEYLNYSTGIFDIVKNGVDKNLNSLTKYEKELGKDVSAFLYNEFKCSEQYLLFMGNLYELAKTNDCRNYISNLYFKNVESLNSNMENPLVKYGFLNIRDIGNKLMLESYYKANGESLTFSARYAELKKIANIGLRDRLIVDFLLSPDKQKYIDDWSQKDSCLTDAYKVINSPILKSALDNELLFVKGKKAYNFSIPDTTGKNVTLESLKGNVVLVKFYGEGCAGCAFFSNMFKTEIYPQFSNSKDFKVVSVSVDATKERWFKAMHSGKYTQPESINLNSKKGIYEPMLNYYHVTGIPFILLIDKNGCIISQLNNFMPSNEISSLIKNALAK